MNDDKFIYKDDCYTKKQLVSFGNYLLSDERKEVIHPNEEKGVNDNDLRNWEK